RTPARTGTVGPRRPGAPGREGGRGTPPGSRASPIGAAAGRRARPGAGGTDRGARVGRQGPGGAAPTAGRGHRGPPRRGLPSRRGAGRSRARALRSPCDPDLPLHGPSPGHLRKAPPARRRREMSAEPTADRELVVFEPAERPLLSVVMVTY